MATTVAIEPGYSPHSSQILEICPHCNRPLCPHCWNHPNLVDKDIGLWKCSNSTCKFEFHYLSLDGK